VDTHRIEQKRPRHLLIRISDGDWVRFNQIDFGFGAIRLEARVCGPGSGGEIHFHLGDADQKRIGVLQIPAISSPDEEQKLACSIIPMVGIQSLELRFAVPSGEMTRLEEIRIF